MELKKSVKADLEWKKPIFFEIGLCVALALILMAFEFIGPREKEETTFQTQAVLSDEDFVPLTKRDELPPPPPPAAPIPSSAIEIVDKNIDVDNDIFSTEYTEDLATETYTIEDAPVQEEPEEKIFLVVEEEPSFPGGFEVMYEMIIKNTVYPPAAKNAGIEGTVMVEFVVEPNGKLSHVTAIRKVAPALDEEAVRVVKSLPAWNPGKQRGKAVRSIYRIPINFTLTN